MKRTQLKTASEKQEQRHAINSKFAQQAWRASNQHPQNEQGGAAWRPFGPKVWRDSQLPLLEVRLGHTFPDPVEAGRIRRLEPWLHPHPLKFDGSDVGRLQCKLNLESHVERHERIDVASPKCASFPALSCSRQHLAVRRWSKEND